MTSSRPYLLRALYEWLVDNACTPYILVDANVTGVSVPPQHIRQDGTIILDISPECANKLIINNQAVEFDARFGGMIRHLYIPVKSILGIYGKENGQGMMFRPEDDGGDEEGGSSKESKPDSKETSSKKKPNLRIVK